jgi:hypothetical protein
VWIREIGGGKLMRGGRVKRKIVLWSVIICFVASALSFAVGDYIGFAKGSTEGYGAGYVEGRDDGYNLGYSEGRENGHYLGYLEGREDGYRFGYSEGYENGYDLGLSEGCVLGYEKGYREGYSDGHEGGYGEGYRCGYNSGYEIGETRGYDNGYNMGRAVGYSIGYSKGYAAGYDNGMDVGRTHGYNIWDPTYQEMKDFIARDKTDENTYTEVYTCVNFAADVVNNAKTENIRCAFVYLEFPVAAHTVVAFNTVDKGLIFIEPQTDEEVSVSAGAPYEHQPWGNILKVVIIW